MLKTMSSGLLGWMMVCVARWLPGEVIGELTGAGAESSSFWESMYGLPLFMEEGLSWWWDVPIE